MLLDQLEPWLLGKEHEKRITVKLVIQVRMRKFQQKLVADFGVLRKGIFYPMKRGELHFKITTNGFFRS